MKVNLEIQHNDNNITEQDIQKAVEKDVKTHGVKSTEIKDIKIYYIPNSNSVYYVVETKGSKEVHGSFSL